MTAIVSLERAVSEGSTPEQLASIADWHEERAAWHDGRGKPQGDAPDRPISKAKLHAAKISKRRHLDIADRLRSLARALRADQRIAA